MPKNPYNPNYDPIRWYSWEIKRNREAYLEKFPEERNVRPGAVANLHRPLNGRSMAKKNTSTRRKRR